jgi:hypothetical protein
LKNHRDCLSSQETIPEGLEYKQVYDRDSRWSFIMWQP